MNFQKWELFSGSPGTKCKEHSDIDGNTIPSFQSRIVKAFLDIFKGAGSRNVNKLFRNDDFAVFLIGHITIIFHYFSQNESVILKMHSCTS